MGGPHASGSLPAFSCAGQLRVVFQTSAFKCVLPDTTFMDVTAFDEHGCVFWATSSVAQLSDALPHSALGDEASAVDFDLDNRSDHGMSRWLCLADAGVASLVLQLSSGYCGQEQQMRLNVISWHTELPYLDWWFGSKYSA